jgi:HEAT repeat protein
MNSPRMSRALFHVFALGVLLCYACTDASKNSAANPADTGANQAEFIAGEALQHYLQLHQSAGLPEVSEDFIAEVQDLLDATTLGGKLANRASRSLLEMEVEHRTAALLGLLEQRLTPVPVQQLAYSWLRDAGLESMLPRLTLRLKYEKDHWAVVATAHTLLKYGNGSGLQALINILDDKSGRPEIEAARSYAATILGELPSSQDQQSSEDFGANWQHLLEVNQLWQTERRLSPDDNDPSLCSPELLAEYWRMIARFESQPLRPVDDARFVLSRQRGFVIPLLLQAARDPNRYIREHALQTLGWIAIPIGHWCARHQVDFVAELVPILASRKSRTRALEALGAAGVSNASEVLWAWVQNGNREEQSAACDAMLRCCLDPAWAVRLQNFLQATPPPRLSSEGEASLYALWFELEPGLESEYPVHLSDNLPQSEWDRRERWTEMRSQSVGGQD